MTATQSTVQPLIAHKPSDYRQETTLANRLIKLALIVALGTVLAACTRQESLRVGIHPWIGYEPLYLARDLGWLPDHVQLREATNANTLLHQLEEGEIDAATLTLDELLVARSRNIPVSAVLVFDVSAGGDAIVARKGIDSVVQLPGKLIAVESSAVGMLVLTKALASVGLTLADVSIKNLPPDRQLQAWQHNGIDAVVTYEPTATQLQHNGAVRIFDTRQLPDTIFDVLAVRTDHLQPTLLRALIRAHFRALEHLRTNRQDALFRIAAHQHVSLPELQNIIGGITMPNLEGNQQYLNEAGPLQKATGELSRFMLDHHLLTRSVNLRGTVTSAFLPAEGSGE